jgi:hypothetical protein
MQDEEFTGETQSFIVRIWHEATGNGKRTAWRGSIIHVGSGKRVYFHNLNSIKWFVQTRTGMEDNDLGKWFRSILSRAMQKEG